MRKWTHWELTKILEYSEVSDKVLAKQINRSQRAIQQKRYFIRKQRKETKVYGK